MPIRDQAIRVKLMSASITLSDMKRQPPGFPRDKTIIRQENALIAGRLAMEPGRNLTVLFGCAGLTGKTLGSAQA